MARRGERIEVRVTQEEKDEINEWLDETGQYGSMSRLMRSLALEHVRNDEEDDERDAVDAEAIQNAVEIAMSDVTERLERIEDGLAHVDVAAGGATEESIDNLADDLARALGVYPDGKMPSLYSLIEEEVVEAEGDPLESSGDALEVAQKRGTANAWATYLDADLNRVRRALARAVDWYPDVQYTFDNPSDDGRDSINPEKRRYYRTTEF
jgi:hypothetical protein